MMTDLGPQEIDKTTDSDGRLVPTAAPCHAYRPGQPIGLCTSPITETLYCSQPSHLSYCSHVTSVLKGARSGHRLSIPQHTGNVTRSNIEGWSRTNTPHVTGQRSRGGSRGGVRELAFTTTSLHHPHPPAKAPLVNPKPAGPGVRRWCRHEDRRTVHRTMYRVREHCPAEPQKI